MRLFVALDLPARVCEALIGWQRSVLAERPALRGVKAAGMHVTLCFLGSRPASALPAIEAACLEGSASACLEGSACLEASAGPDGDAGGGPRAPALALGDALWLPARRPRVLSVSLQDPDDGLAHLQASLAHSLANACGYEPEQREFRPHVTIARVRGRARFALEPVPPPPALAFDASRISLYRSHLDAAGPRYERLLTVELGDPRRARPPAAR
jgi:2'-5' RNA ligase